MKVLSVLAALAATVGILVLVSAPTGVEHQNEHQDEQTEHVEDTTEGHHSGDNGYIVNVFEPDYRY